MKAFGATRVIGVVACLLILCGILYLAVSGSSIVLGGQEETAAQTVAQTRFSPGEPLHAVPLSIEDTILGDDPYVYAQDDPGSVVTMYLTIRAGNAADGTNHTWEDVNSNSIFYYEYRGIERYRVEAILQVGDENGPLEGEVGYGAQIPNAFVQVRGNTTSNAAQKSFKVALKEGAGAWRGQTTIALNKHPYDGLRFRSKLCYDLIRDVPGMVGMRTQFVRLYVKDESDSGTGAGFEDYGLFTQVEQPNRTFLFNHGLDRNGQFYKANYFEFFRHEDALKLVTDPTFDQTIFDTVLESKGSDDHSKLIEMLEALNDYSIPIEETFERYFDADNYFTWLAFHILVYNTDTINRNYYLYSPLNSDTFYFVTWDVDASLRIQERMLLSPRDVSLDEYYGYQQGISNYWGITLHRRILEVDEYRARLDEKVHEVKEILSRERIEAMVAIYRAATEPIVYAEPDVSHALLSPERYDYLVDTLADEVDLAYEMYANSLTKPMPFFGGFALSDDGTEIVFSWETAFSFEKQFVTYEFELARDILFEDMVHSEADIIFPDVTVPMLPEGRYYYRITATDENGRSQSTLAYFADSNRTIYYGVLCFDVLPDGTAEIVESEVEVREMEAGGPDTEETFVREIDEV